MIIAAPMRSFTLAAGLKYSSLAKIVALTPCCPGNLRRRTIGVSPTASTMLSNTLPRPGRCVCAALVGISMMNPPAKQCENQKFSWSDCAEPRALATGARRHARCVAKTREFLKETHLCCDFVKQIIVCCG